MYLFYHIIVMYIIDMQKLTKIKFSMYECIFCYIFKLVNMFKILYKKKQAKEEEDCIHTNFTFLKYKSRLKQNFALHNFMNKGSISATLDYF